MNVILSGFNLDIETLKELRDFVQQVSAKLDGKWFLKQDAGTKNRIIEQLQEQAVQLIGRDNFTPETLSAAYARISRNPLPVNQLREIARLEVDRARKSNQNIIFGLGHSSVAEHAVFNFDILGVSRYAVETIEHFRLASYTEKSQRYILFEEDYVIPAEIKIPALEKEFVGLMKKQSDTYYQLYEQLKPYFFKLYPDQAKDPKNHRLLDGLAKEDARYVISLATGTQLGMTVNARTLENMVAKCSCHPLAEIREYGQKLYDVTRDYTPSIVKYVQPSEYLLHKEDDIQTILNSLPELSQSEKQDPGPDVFLLDYPPDADKLILSTLLFKRQGTDFRRAREVIDTLSHKDKIRVFQQIYKNINSWEGVLREFEFVTFTFQLLVSASCYGQLKRHRMANIVSQDYDVSLGITLPESIKAIGQESLFLEIIKETEHFFLRLTDFNPSIAPYVLTNAHRRRVLFKINLRELYHFSRLREDQHAQWDIRNIARQMGILIKEKLPLSAALIGGKDRFREIYQTFMNR